MSTNLSDYHDQNQRMAVHQPPCRHWWSALMLLIMLIGLPVVAAEAPNQKAPKEITGTIHVLPHGCGNPAYQGPAATVIVVDEKSREIIALEGNVDLKKIKLGGRVTVTGSFKAHDVQAGPRMLTFTNIQASVAAEGGAAAATTETGTANATPSATEPVVVAAAPTLTNLKCLLVFANTNDFTVSASTITSVQNLLFNNAANVANGIEHATYGHYKLIPGDTVTVTLNVTASGMSSSTMWTNMQNAAAAAGYPLANYDRVLCFSPSGVNFNGAIAYGYMPGKHTIYASNATTSSMDVYNHELGHNFGFAHSGLEGQSSQYGDEFCAMGISHQNTSRTATYSAVKKLQAGWFATFPGVNTAITGDVTYDLYPISQNPDSVPGMRLVQLSGTNYYISYMKRGGSYEYMNATQAVTVHTHTSGSVSRRQSAMQAAGNQYSAGTANIIVERFGPSNNYATVSFDLNDGNTKPVANPQTRYVMQNTNLALVLTGSDADNNPLTYSTVTTPVSGVLTGTAPNLTYTPNTGFAGTDSFVFKVHDGKISSFATITINVMSTPPAVTWTAASQTSASESGTMTVTATLSYPAIAGTVTLPFTVSGTATPVSDYTISSSPITIPAQGTTGSATITIVGDSIHELNGETVILTMGTPTNAILGTTTVHTATIKDDDNTAPVVNAGPDQTAIGIPTVLPPTGWAYAQWTGDANSGISSGHGYTAKHSFGNNRTSATVNGVTFTEGNVTSGTGWSIGGTATYWNGDDDAAVTGGSELLAQEFVYGAAPRTVTFTGLTVGQTYEASFYSVAWETGTRTQTFSTPGVTSMDINQDQYGNNMGIRITCVYTATATSQVFTITPLVAASTFHLYAIANRGVPTLSATVSLDGTVSDANGDPLATTWTLVSGPGPVSIATPSAVDTTATFSVAGTYVLRLTANDGYGPIYDEVTITVSSGPSVPTVAWTAPSQSSASESGTLTVTAQLSAVSAQTVTVPFTVSGTASGADYSITGSPITITAGQTTGTATITITADAIAEPNETVIMTMGTPTNASLGAITVHTATITDDDVAIPTVAWTVASQSSAGETGTLTVTAQLSGVSAQSVSVPFTVTGTASGADYTITASPITITAGQTTGTATITITADTLDEANETVILTMGTPTNATQGGITVHTATITDDDATPTVTWTAPSQSSVGESGTLTVTAQLSAASAQNVSVPFTVTGTSSAGDRTITASPVTITAGATTGTATITITADTLDEANETVILTMGTPTNATFGAITAHTATITDDDATPTVTFTAASQASAGESGTLTVTAQLSTASGQAVSVPFTVSGTSGAGDRTITASPISIAAGATSATATITITADTLDEANETVILTMGTPTNATVGAITQHTATITDDDATPTVAWTTPSQSSVGESGTLTVTAQLSAASGQAVSVPFTVSGTSGAGDRTITASPISIAAGATTGTATITITADTTDEANETVILTLDTPTNASLGATTIHTATITDDDAAPTVAFTATSSSGSEATTAVTIPVSLSAASGQTVTVAYAVSGGTASGGGVDYTLASGTLTFTAGITTQNIAVTVVNDASSESNETIQVTLSSPSNASLGGTTAHTYTITDDDSGLPTVAWTAPSQSSAGESGTLTVTAQLSAVSAQTVTVPFTVTGTSSAGDRTITASPITITAGQNTGTATITITADSIDEANETVILTIGTPTNATQGATTVHTATITDDDAAPTVTWTVANQSSAGETGTMTVTAQLSAASGQAVSVPFTVTGTATGADYTITESPITINAGATTGTATITITADTTVEANETVILTLNTPTNATLGAITEHTATITDDDGMPTVAWTVASQSSAGESGTLTVTAALSATSAQTVTVPFTVTGTSSAGDRTITASPITITAGQTTGTVTITITADSIDEANETVILTMGTPTNATLGAITQHTATITDDDAAPTVAFTAPSSGGSEAVTSVNLPVSLSQPSAQTVTVNYAVTGGTATGGGVDYTLANGTLTFTAGTTMQNITVTIVSDALVEGDETIQVTLSTPSNATLGAITAHTYTLTDSSTTASNGNGDDSKCGLGSGLTALLLLSLMIMARLRGRS